MAGSNTAMFQVLGKRLLKMLALVLGSGIFIPVGCTSIGVLLLTTPHEVRPDNRLYRSFFTVAVVSDGSAEYVWLSQLPKFKAEHPNLSFIVPKPYHCGHEWCREQYRAYRVVSDTGAEQVIEVQVEEDSGFALMTWSRYRATHSDITPISLRKLGGMELYPYHVIYAFFCSLVIHAIGVLLRKITNKGVDNPSPLRGT